MVSCTVVKCFNIFLALVVTCGFIVSSEALTVGDGRPALYLVQGFFGLNTKTQDTGSSQVSTRHLGTQISSDFLTAIGYSNPAGSPFIADLKQDFTAHFSAIFVATITDENKFRTYAVSVEITRADQFKVQRPDGNVDVYLPLSGTVYFTNIMTGEILYTKTLTHYANLRFTQNEFSGGLASQVILRSYTEEFKSILNGLMEQSSVEFRPFQISATVVDTPFGLYLLNQGYSAGIAKGSELLTKSGSGLRVLYADKNYSLAELTLGIIRKDDQLFMYSTAKASDVVKPRAMIMYAGTPHDLPSEFAQLAFADNIGNNAAFTMIPENPEAAAVMGQVSRNAGVRQSEVTQNRMPPDYFIRMHVDEPKVYFLPTTHQFSSVRIIDGDAFAELLDESGRVLSLSSAHETLKDQIMSGGMSFDLGDRKKVLYANLFRQLTNHFIQEVHFDDGRVLVSDVNQSNIMVDDASHLLGVGRGYVVYRKIHNVALKTDINVPIWQIATKQRTQSQVLSELSLPLTPKPEQVKTNDFVLLTSMGHQPQSIQSIGLCSDYEQKGNFQIHHTVENAYLGLASSSNLPFNSSDIKLFPDEITMSEEQDILKYSGFRTSVHFIKTHLSYCEKPLIKVDITGKTCDQATHLCSVSLKIIAGIQIYHQSTQWEKVGSPELLQVNDSIENAPEDSLDDYLESQVNRKIEEIFRDVARKVSPDKI